MHEPYSKAVIHMEASYLFADLGVYVEKENSSW